MDAERIINIKLGRVGGFAEEGSTTWHKPRESPYGAEACWRPASDVLTILRSRPFQFRAARRCFGQQAILGPRIVTPMEAHPRRTIPVARNRDLATNSISIT